MKPAFQRGDILFLNNPQDDSIRVGEVVVFKVKGRDIPIVHRVLNVHEREDGEVFLLTKGDNNFVNDRGLYAQGENKGKRWLKREDILGRARGCVRTGGGWGTCVCLQPGGLLTLPCFPHTCPHTHTASCRTSEW